MFPTTFSLGVAELGPLTGNGSGILNMAIVGGAIVPLIQGAIADHIGIHHAFFVLLPVHLVLRAKWIETKQRTIRDGLD
jgi:MFS transporter, FHS family, L-fucose permease